FPTRRSSDLAAPVGIEVDREERGNRQREGHAFEGTGVLPQVLDEEEAGVRQPQVRQPADLRIGRQQAAVDRVDPALHPRTPSFVFAFSVASLRRFRAAPPACADRGGGASAGRQDLRVTFVTRAYNRWV